MDRARFLLALRCGLIGIQDNFHGESYFVPWVSAAPADIMNVHVERYASGRYSFTVTVNHPDEGWDQYADGFELLGARASG